MLIPILRIFYIRNTIMKYCRPGRTKNQEKPKARSKIQLRCRDILCQRNNFFGSYYGNFCILPENPGFCRENSSSSMLFPLGKHSWLCWQLLKKLKTVCGGDCLGASLKSSVVCGRRMQAKVSSLHLSSDFRTTIVQVQMVRQDFQSVIVVILWPSISELLRPIKSQDINKTEGMQESLYRCRPTVFTYIRSWSPIYSNGQLNKPIENNSLIWKLKQEWKSILHWVMALWNSFFQPQRRTQYQ